LPDVAATRRKLYEQLEALPPNKVGEIVDGLLIVSPRPSLPHAVAETALAGLLAPPFMFGRGGPGGWWILSEPELHFGDDVLVPDLAGWRRERLPQMPEVAACSVVPDWVCEIISPSNASLDRETKMTKYAHLAIPHAWVIDPGTRMLEPFTNDGTGWSAGQTLHGNVIARIPPFADVPLSLELLWIR
jgi:Uma2 family endonuclease